MHTMTNETPGSSTASVNLADIKKMKREILRSLWLRGRPPTEGSTSSEELLYLASTVQRTGARVIGEIGFNAGFSSYSFLSANPETRVVSFDLGEHAYSKTAKKLIDKKFPGRHTLINGDSTKTLPDYKTKHPDLYFDLAFIDGGHDYEVAKADIMNMRAFCTVKSAVIIDDLTPWLDWGKGPFQAWTEAIQQGAVRQEELFKDGLPVEVMEPPGKRSWALGSYLY
jgi:predicted O-methyltransferase YrrM